MDKMNKKRQGSICHDEQVAYRPLWFLVKNGYHIVLLKIKWLNYAKLRSYHSTYTLHTPFPVSYLIHSEHTRTHYNVGQTLSNQDYEDSHPIGCL